MVSFGSMGVGSTAHLGLEMLQSKAGIKLLHVPYKGSTPIMSDLLGGQIDSTITNVVAIKPYIESGKVRGLAVTTLKRSSVLPDLPAIAEFYPGVEVNSWYGVIAPGGTPKEIVSLLQREIADILKQPDIRSLLNKGGLEPEGTTPEEYAAKIKEDLVRWAAVVKEAGLAPK